MWYYKFWYFSNMKMEVACTSETSVNIYHTTQGHIPEDSNLHRQ